MKRYIEPAIEIVNIETQQLMAGSGGLTTGSKPGNEYTPGDVNYSRGSSWDDEDDEEW